MNNKFYTTRFFLATNMDSKADLPPKGIEIVLAGPSASSMFIRIRFAFVNLLNSRSLVYLTVGMALPAPISTIATFSPLTLMVHLKKLDSLP